MLMTLLFPSLERRVLFFSSFSEHKQRNVWATKYHCDSWIIRNSSIPPFRNRPTDGPKQNSFVFCFVWICCSSTIETKWEGDFMERNRFLSRSVESNLFLLLLTSERIVFHSKELLFYVNQSNDTYGHWWVNASALMTNIHLLRDGTKASAWAMLRCSGNSVTLEVAPTQSDKPVMSIAYFIAVTLSRRQKSEYFHSVQVLYVLTDVPNVEIDFARSSTSGA